MVVHNRALFVLIRAVANLISFTTRAIQFVVLAGGVTFAVVGISEISARQNLIGVYMARIDELQDQLLERDRESTEAHSARLEIEKKRRLAEEVQSLAIFGATNDVDTLVGIRRDSWMEVCSLGSELESTTSQLAPMAMVTETASDKIATLCTPELDSLPTILGGITGFRPSLMSNDNLLALIVLMSGTVGALIASIRGGVRVLLQPITLGFASGFVSFLAIKGGRHVFLLQVGGELLAFNPYSCAFAALLAGLFTERAYELLSLLVDQLGKSVRAAMNATHEQGEGKGEPGSNA